MFEGRLTDRYKEAKMLMLVICGIVLFTGARGANRIPISVISGVYWTQIEQAVVYESSIPLVYKTAWPSVDVAYLPRPLNNGFCNDKLNDPLCTLFAWILQVDKQMSKQISWLNTSISEESSSQSGLNNRVTRSLKFLGDAAHWCCGIVTHRQLKPLFANQVVMSKYEQGLQSQLAEAFSEIDNVTVHMNDYSRQLEATFARVIDVGVNITKVIDRFQKQMYAAELKDEHKIYSLLQVAAHQTIRQLQGIQLISRLEILGQCREKKIPNTIVTLARLRSDLISISNSITKDGYELAVPVDDLTKYLKLEISDCVISEETVLVHLKVPIKRRDSQWKLYELLAVPFAWNNSTCSVQHEARFVAVDGDRLMAIQGAVAHDCRPYNDPLCYVPRYAGDAVSGSLCPRKMFFGATIQELSSLCVFSCVPGNIPLVSKVDDATYVLTHVTGTLTLRCRHGINKTISIPSKSKLGALEIKVPCDCKLLNNEQILVSEAYPCHKQSASSSVVHMVPAPWSKLKSLKLSSQPIYPTNTFETLEECLDEAWPLQVPHWNLSFSDRNRKMNEKPVIFTPAEDQFEYNLVSVTLHVIYMFIVSIIVIRNPHLIGFGINVPVRAESEGMNLENNMLFPVVYVVATILIFVLSYLVLSWLWGVWKGRHSDENISMTARRTGLDKDDGLPKSLPITEIQGKELRITLEWWEPAGTKDDDRES